MHVLTNDPKTTRCSVILAGGDGRRLQPLVHELKGNVLPKQYVSFIGKRSMLEHTFERAEQLIPAHRLFVIIAREHLKFREVRRQIALRPPHTVVVQPENRDTGPGLLLPLTYLYKRYPDAVIAVFPSDHFILEEDVFMRHVDLAFQLVEQDGSRIVLLGLGPHEPDPEYGYIVPGQEINDSSPAARKVELFVEKPAAEVAKKIIQKGALWNTMVMVFRLTTLMDVFQRVTPELYGSFQPILKAIGTADEQRVLERVYEGLRPLNFSRGILEALPFEYRQALLALPVHGVFWSDWGLEDRLLAGLKKIGRADVLREGIKLQEKNSFKMFDR